MYNIFFFFKYKQTSFIILLHSKTLVPVPGTRLTKGDGTYLLIEEREKMPGSDKYTSAVKNALCTFIKPSAPLSITVHLSKWLNHFEVSSTFKSVKWV